MKIKDLLKIIGIKNIYKVTEEELEKEVSKNDLNFVIFQISMNEYHKKNKEE